MRWVYKALGHISQIHRHQGSTALVRLETGSLYDLLLSRKLGIKVKHHTVSYSVLGGLDTKVVLALGQ